MEVIAKLKPGFRFFGTPCVCPVLSRVVDLGRALVCAEFEFSPDTSRIDAKFKSLRAVIEKVHGYVVY